MESTSSSSSSCSVEEAGVSSPSEASQGVVSPERIDRSDSDGPPRALRVSEEDVAATSLLERTSSGVGGMAESTVEVEEERG